jgi:putative ATPase
VAIDRLVALAGGDARRSLGCLEACAATCVDGEQITAAMVVEAFQHRALQHDKDGDLHYDLLSALHKSLRNSDVQAAVYWLARALEAGADPVHAARRLVAVAAEDIGLADPMALQVAVSALQALQFLGLPEGRLPLTEAVVYLAAAPKSNAVYRAIHDAMAMARDGAQHPVPIHLRNATTGLMKDLGTAKATCMRTTPRKVWRVWSACRRNCVRCSSTNPATAASRRRCRSAWSRTTGCGRGRD